MAMDPIIAYCGLVCSQCPVYVHTLSGNMAELEKLAIRIREEYGAPNASATSIMCEGCVGEGRRASYCAECAVRACGATRGVANCAACADYPCGILDALFAKEPKGREVLEALRG